MIGIDTNVLVRYILDDDPLWSKSAQYFIDDACTVDRPGYINLIVLIELVCFLGVTPGWGRSQISKVVGDLLFADNLVLENKSLVADVLDAYVSGKADFADYMIAAINQQANAAPTVTIDRAAAKSTGFSKLPRKVGHV